MKKLLILPLVLSLANCTTLNSGATRVGNYMCDRQEAIRLGAIATIQNASFINDPVIRASVIGTAQAQITALEQCATAP